MSTTSTHPIGKTVPRVRQWRLVQRLYVYFRNCLTVLSPRLNTIITYRISKGVWPNLRDPKTFNEKVSWLKVTVYNHSDAVRACANKVDVRDYVRSVGLERILVPIHGLYRSVDDLHWPTLPTQFALKWSVGAGANFICVDKASVNEESVIKALDHAGRRNFHLANAELQYAKVQRVLICEQSLLDPFGRTPADFKFDCSYGDVIALLVCTDRDQSVRWTRIDRWEEASTREYAELFGVAESLLKHAAQCARRLSKPFPYVRVDLYLVDGKVYFGELTFTPAGGIDSGLTAELDQVIGQGIRLPADDGKFLKSASMHDLV